MASFIPNPSGFTGTGGGRSYIDASPRTPVTADAPGCDYSRYCVWVWEACFTERGYRFSLKSVHGRCALHQHLRRSQPYTAQEARQTLAELMAEQA